MRPSLSKRHPLGVAAALALVLTLAACTTADRAAPNEPPIADAVATLGRDLPGDLAALYDMRVSSTGGLRLAVVTSGGRGRMTISEPFGSAVSLTAWNGDGTSVHFDLDRGCRSDAGDLRAVLGLRALPLAQAVRLLGGRLPAARGDAVIAVAAREIEIRGAGWGSSVTVAANPWRVLSVRELGGDHHHAWTIQLDDHTSSVPGRVRVTNADGRWAELELRRLEWPSSPQLPDLPDLPPCADTRSRPGSDSPVGTDG